MALKSNHPGVAIIGCGKVGYKRAAALQNARLLACSDLDHTKAAALALDHPGAVACQDWRTAIQMAGVEIVIVSTTHDALPVVTCEALQAGRHVLVEKPAGRNAEELEQVLLASQTCTEVVRVGYNHRFHPAIREAHRLVAAGEIGDLMVVRGRYGHGGRLGYEKEWRANPSLSGGGELIDQGVHLIDLAQWFMGNLELVHGIVPTMFWKMPVEDNVFMALRNKNHAVAWLHASCTEWKNLFSFEIFGRTGKVMIDGLGGSYGTERLTVYQMLPKMGPPDSFFIDYPGDDSSWSLEFWDFLEDIRLGRKPEPGLSDALSVLKIVDRIYMENHHDHNSQPA